MDQGYYLRLAEGHKTADERIGATIDEAFGATQDRIEEAENSHEELLEER